MLPALHTQNSINSVQYRITIEYSARSFDGCLEHRCAHSQRRGALNLHATAHQPHLSDVRSVDDLPIADFTDPHRPSRERTRTVARRRRFSTSSAHLVRSNKLFNVFSLIRHALSKVGPGEGDGTPVALLVALGPYRGEVDASSRCAVPRRARDDISNLFLITVSRTRATLLPAIPKVSNMVTFPRTTPEKRGTSLS